MLKINRKLTIFMFCIFFVITASVGAAADNMFICDLTSNSIGPKPADTEANGSAIFLFDENKQELTYKLLVEKIEDAYMAHLHIGPADKEGLLAVWLYPLPGHKPAKRTIEGQFNGTLAEGVIGTEDLENGVTYEELIESLRNDNAYVNVHTEKFVMGAIRGQVHSEQYTSHMERMPTAAGSGE